ncbi:MAG: phosphoesterase [Betaproteobacteria bacterium]|nr:phosphoesterase [Betaproteobacteria bacterium]
MNKSTLVIYHKNCPDGFGAAFAAWKRFKEKAIYHPAQYGDKPPYDECRGRDVFVLDFSYPREQLIHIYINAQTLTVLNHHKTAQADLEDLSFATFSMIQSGAMLAWKHFVSQPVPRFIEYIQDRDLWKWELTDSREFSAALYSYPFDFATWDSLYLDTDHLIAEGKAILRMKEKAVKEMADRSVIGNVGGYMVPIVNATIFFSEVGEELCIRHPDKPFAAYYFDREDNRRQWGLRSRGDFDCSAVAKSYGGGGHPGAAGFTALREEP